MTTLQDSFGNKSSKRLWGTISLSIGVAMKIALFVCSLFIVVKDPATASTASDTLMYTGGALLGIGVVEHFAKGKK
jgi:hypothetical protein